MGSKRRPCIPCTPYIDSDSTVLRVTLASPYFSAHTQLVVEEERDNGATRWLTTLAGTPATIPTRLEEAEPAGEDITRGEGHMTLRVGAHDSMGHMTSA